MAAPPPELAPIPPPFALSEEQRRVVEHPISGGHLLVRAGPGSGKTETIRARIASLISQLGVQPDAILALTFSRRAAINLTQRIRPADVWSGTFHAVSVDILERWGESNGITLPLHIYAEERQEDALLQAIARVGITPDSDAQRQRCFTGELKNRISRRKRSGRDEPDRQIGDDWIPDELVAQVDEAYRGVLAEAGALDFDDLITEAISILRTDLDAASHYQTRLRFVFIDEFHDISPEQFELVRLLAPARSEVQVVAIADPDQAIYAWRGAHVATMLGAFRREYRPREFQLRQNFRCTSEIIAAANAVIGENRTSPPTTALSQTGQSRRLPVDIVQFADEEAEATALIRFIQRAIDSGGYSYGDIAVLYRTHGRSELAAALLPQHGLPIARVEPGRFFRQPEVQEGLRYLELLLALRDDHFVPALNWPRVLVDEVTMVHLRRLARREATTLCDLARRIDDFTDEVSPLTRAAVRDFFATVADPLGDLVEQPVGHLIEPFLNVLRRRRSPIPRAHRVSLRDTLELLGGRLVSEASALATAVANGQPIAVRTTDDDGDSAAAIVILAHTLRCYYDRDLIILEPGHDPPAQAFVIELGQERDATGTGCGLTVWVTPYVTFTLGALAWRLGQLLLMHHEAEPDLPLVAFDLETGDRHPQTAEIIEIGADRLGGPANGDRLFARLVRPSSPSAITRSASNINGLTWNMVATQPAVADVLPELLAFLDDAVLVGHNIEDFDYPILRRTVSTHRASDAPRLRHLLIDTYKMARRVLPEQRSYRLEDLARLIDRDARQTHRVAGDLGLTTRLFTYLRQQHRRHLELETLTEALPVVALSLLAAGVAIKHDNALLAEIGARAAAFGQGGSLQAAWHERVDPALAKEGATWLAAYRPEAAAESSADDQAWATMEAHWHTALDVYSRHGGETSLAGFLRYAALAEPIDVVPLSDQPQDDDAADDDPRRLGRAERIAMMSVHSAKGLEWPLVFLLGVEAGQFPHYRTQTPADTEEERRLLYVGMTRARQRLCLLWSCSTRGHAQRLSPFLDAVPAETITRR